MPNELTNLLPHERRSALRRAYFLRLGVVSALIVTVLASTAAILLLPAYVFLMKSIHTKEARLANIKTTLSSADEATLSARLTALTNDATTLTALAGAPSVSSVIRNALAVPHSGITLTGFSYTPTLPPSAPSAPPVSSQGEPAVVKSKGTLAIVGIATTRAALRSFQLALQSAPFALSADLPVSAYAKDTNSTFTIILTLAP